MATAIAAIIIGDGRMVQSLDVALDFQGKRARSLCKCSSNRPSWFCLEAEHDWLLLTADGTMPPRVRKGSP